MQYKYNWLSNIMSNCTYSPAKIHFRDSDFFLKAVAGELVWYSSVGSCEVTLPTIQTTLKLFSAILQNLKIKNYGCEDTYHFRIQRKINVQSLKQKSKQSEGDYYISEGD